MTKVILIISSLLCCLNIQAQDSLFQCDFSVNSINFLKEYYRNGNYASINKNHNIIPSLTVSFPIQNKFSFSAGLTVHYLSYDGYIHDSTLQTINPVDPESGHGKFIHHIKSSETSLSLLVGLNYSLYNSKHFSTSISLGIEADTWDNQYECWEYYPISATNNSKYNNSQFNSLTTISTYSSYLNISLKYFPFMHFGVLVRPYINYNFDNADIISYLGIGLCYR